MPKRGGRGSWTGSRRWTRREAGEVLAELERSGASLAAFARREGLSAERLYRWRARLTKTKATFVEIRPDAVVNRGGAALEVVLAGGRTLRVPSDFDEVALRRLIAVLEGAC